MPHDANATGRGSCKARDNADERGFSRAVGAQKAKKLAFVNLKGHMIKGSEAAKGFGNPLNFKGNQN
jgi:hypothetical protein